MCTYRGGGGGRGGEGGGRGGGSKMTKSEPTYFMDDPLGNPVLRGYFFPYNYSGKAGKN